MIFGRFLGFIEKSPNGDNLESAPLGLTERRFRGFYDRTDAFPPSVSLSRAAALARAALIALDVIGPQLSASPCLPSLPRIALRLAQWRFRIPSLRSHTFRRLALPY